MSGEHYLLTDKEYYFLSDAFDFGGIPKYMIINNKGRVVDDDAPRPGEAILVGVLESFIKEWNNPS